MSMSEVEALDLNRGFKEYNSKVKNLEGIFTKVEDILDISGYKQSLKEIEEELKNENSLNSEMISNSMQLEFESMVLAPYIKRIDKLTEDINKDLLPFYELNLLISKTNLELREVNEENLVEILTNARKILDLINKLNTHDEKNKKALINKGYEIIYRVILEEELFDRNDTLTYLNKLNIPTNKENIGRYLSKDIKSLDEKTKIEEELRTVNEGLGYDYLTPEFISKVARVTIGEKNEEYQRRRMIARDKITEEVVSYKNRSEKASSTLKSLSSERRNLLLKKYRLASRILSMALVPIITITSGYSIGKKSSSKIPLYKTITRTVDSSTGEIVGDIDFVYDERETTYVATVMEYGPYRKNPTGVGYVRNVTAYEYIAPEDAGETYHATSEDLQGNVKEKYTFVEQKDTLDDNDSVSESTILITETYQDKNDWIPSNKYTLGLTIVGVLAGVAIDVILTFAGFYDLDKIKRMIGRINRDLEDNKISEEEAKQRILDLKNEIPLLIDRYNDTIRKYGNLDSTIDPEEIKTLELKMLKK